MAQKWRRSGAEVAGGKNEKFCIGVPATPETSRPRFRPCSNIVQDLETGCSAWVELMVLSSALPLSSI